MEIRILEGFLNATLIFNGKIEFMKIAGRTMSPPIFASAIKKANNSLILFILFLEKEKKKVEKKKRKSIL